jgi:hypothetical protein
MEKGMENISKNSVLTGLASPEKKKKALLADYKRNSGK